MAEAGPCRVQRFEAFKVPCLVGLTPRLLGIEGGSIQKMTFPAKQIQNLKSLSKNIYQISFGLQLQSKSQPSFKQKQTNIVWANPHLFSMVHL